MGYSVMDVGDRLALSKGADKLGGIIDLIRDGCCIILQIV